MIVDNLTVGYHVWADNSHLALFVLGEPNTLHYLRLPTKEDTIIASNIGRSLHKVPNERSISFVHKVAEGNWQIKKLNTETMKIATVASTVPGKEDIAWTPTGTLLTSDGAQLLALRGKSWKPVAVTEGQTLLKGITRLAVSADGKKLAVVVSE